MNVAPALGLSFLNIRGQPLQSAGTVPTMPAAVNLVQTRQARSKSFVEAGVDAEVLDGACIFFEPDVHSLEAHGLGAPEFVLTLLITTTVHHPHAPFCDNSSPQGSRLYPADTQVLGNGDVLSLDPGGQCDEAVIAAVSTSSSNRMQNLLEVVTWPAGVKHWYQNTRMSLFVR